MILHCIIGTYYVYNVKCGAGRKGCDIALYNWYYIHNVKCGAGRVGCLVDTIDSRVMEFRLWGS